MKKILTSIALAVAFVLNATAGNYTSLVNGFGYTNATVVLVNSTNQVGVVLASATNTYSLLSSYGSQDKFTNWPAAFVNPQGNYPNTLYGPNRIEGLFVQLTNTTGIADNHVLTFAGSVDGSLWVPNALSFQVTVGTPFYTNWDSGALPYLALQSIANTNASVALTNIVIEATGKPGL